MKKIFVLLALISLFCGLLVILSCKKDVKNPFVGTWNGSDNYGDAITFVITESAWTASWPGTGYAVLSGTYTYSGKTATFTAQVGTGTATISGNTMTGMLPGRGGFTVMK
jgi:hypothetical protein